MNNKDYKETPNPSLPEELSTLEKHFLPGGVLIKGIETLASMRDNVIALDNALLQLAKTSDLSAGELKSITEEAFRMGDAVGRTGTDVLSSMTAARQAGYDMKDALALTEEALKMTNLSNNVTDTGTAMQNLKSILDGFGEDTDFAARINDAITSISNTDIVGFDSLLDGASRLSSSANQANMSFEEMLGTLTGAYEVIGDMDKVTEGELAIFSRLQNTYGEAKNVYDILDNLYTKWSDLEDEPSKDAFIISEVGTDQKEVFTALMDNWNGVEQAVYSASNSFGTANAANETYLDSITGKTESFKNQVEQLSSSIMDSDLLKFFLDLGTTGVNALNGITEKIGSLGTLATLGSGYLGSKGLGQHKSCDTYGCEAQESSYCCV